MPENILALTQAGQCVRVNRFQLLARLMQLYILENFSRYIDMRLEYLRQNQHLFRTFGQESMFGAEAAELLPDDEGHPGVALPPTGEDHQEAPMHVGPVDDHDDQQRLDKDRKSVGKGKRG